MALWSGVFFLIRNAYLLKGPHITQKKVLNLCRYHCGLTRFFFSSPHPKGQNQINIPLNFLKAFSFCRKILHNLFGPFAQLFKTFWDILKKAFIPLPKSVGTTMLSKSNLYKIYVYFFQSRWYSTPDCWESQSFLCGLRRNMDPWRHRQLGWYCFGS